MVSVGYFATLTGSFGAVKSSGDALEAQRVAEIESNKIRLTDYENLDSKVQQDKWVDAPDNHGWQYFVTLGNEKVIDGDNKQRIAEVKVRRKGDEESRFSTVVPVSSEDASGSGFKCKNERFADVFELIADYPWWRSHPRNLIAKKSVFGTVSLGAHINREHGFDTPSGSISINGIKAKAQYDGDIVTVPISKGDRVTIRNASFIYLVSCK